MSIENLKYNFGFFGWCATRDAEFHSKESRPHFDISQKSMIVWKDESELIERLKRRIEKKMIFLVVLTICKWYTQLDNSEFVVMDMYWNHNSAYYPWVKKKTENCMTILDVGCGDGSLAFFLDDGTKRIVGIDPDHHCIERASSVNDSGNLQFRCCGFENFTPDMRFDAIVFVASIHHMDMAESLQKAKSLLSPSGKLLIVGLAAPSSITDWVLEAARVIPSKVISALHHMQTSEELNISTSYDYPAMKEIRSIVKKELPGARMHYALHYRYLLEWVSR